MRILIIASESPPVASGVAHSVDRLVRGLRQRGHEVDTLRRRRPLSRLGEVRLSGLGGRLLGLAHEIAGSTTWSTFTGRFLPSPTSRWGSCGPSGAAGPRVLYTHHSTLEFDAGLLAGLGSAIYGAHRPPGPPRGSRCRHERGVRRCIRGRPRSAGLGGAVGRRRRSLSASESQRVRRHAATAGAVRRSAAAVQGSRGRDRRRRPPAAALPHGRRPGFPEAAPCAGADDSGADNVRMTGYLDETGAGRRLPRARRLRPSLDEPPGGLRAHAPGGDGRGLRTGGLRPSWRCVTSRVERAARRTRRRGGSALGSEGARRPPGCRRAPSGRAIEVASRHSWELRLCRVPRPRGATRAIVRELRLQRGTGDPSEGEQRARTRDPARSESRLAQARGRLEVGSPPPLALDWRSRSSRSPRHAEQPSPAATSPMRGSSTSRSPSSTWRDTPTSGTTSGVSANRPRTSSSLPAPAALPGRARHSRGAAVADRTAHPRAVSLARRARCDPADA